jgi:hypothetical protein
MGGATRLHKACTRGEPLTSDKDWDPILSGKGRRELLNLKSSINYGDASASSWRGKSKAHVL